MEGNRIMRIREAWKGSSSRFYSPALWMTDEELETVAGRVAGCSVDAIHRAVQAAENAFAILDYANSQPSVESRSGASELNGGIVKTSFTRTLKIEATGDFFKQKIKPRIRIGGQWLERAGFKPGRRVEIRFIKEGELTLMVRPPRLD